MSDTTHDIKELLNYLAPRAEINCDFERYHAALAALVAENAALKQERDEAHGLIRKWCETNAVELEEQGDMLYALAPHGINPLMSEADKRAFLAATRKGGGGA